MTKKQIITSACLFIVLSLSLTGCGKKEEAAVIEIPPIAVKTQKMGASKTAQNNLEFPGTVVAESEAKVIAKSSGNASLVTFNVGDKVSTGLQLLKIDDVEQSGGTSGGFNASQVKQAVLAVNQAQASYQLAKTNYENLVLSSAKDLRQAEIAKEQAGTAKNNLNITTEEAVKSADLAHDAAVLAVEQAKINLDSKTKILNQAVVDAKENALTGSDSVIAACGAALNVINNTTGIDTSNNIQIPYKDALGALDSSTYESLRSAYVAAKASFDSYNKKKPSDPIARVDAAIKVAEDSKIMVDKYRDLLDKTVSSGTLTQTALSSLQNNASSMISQINSGLLQISGTKQGLNNLNLSNDSAIEALEKTYELAKKQESQTAQALKNVKAGNTSQLDQAGLTALSAQNQYENAQVKIETQLTAARTQMNLAEIQYQNASVALQGLYDSRTVISPIDGTVTKKLISDGEVVSAGQLLAVISQTTDVKVQFYIDQDLLEYVKPGLTVNLVNADNQEITGIVTAVSPQADATTKRFLVEVKPENKTASTNLTLGTIINVKVTVKRDVSAASNNIILPLSAINIGQAENYIFTEDNGLAKKQVVELGQVHGEYAEIKVDLPAEANIIVEGVKMLSDGQKVEVK